MAKVITDRFGKSCLIAMTKDKSGSGFHTGYVTLKGQLYSITFSDKCNKDNGSGYLSIKKINKKKQESF